MSKHLRCWSDTPVPRLNCDRRSSNVIVEKNSETFLSFAPNCTTFSSLLNAFPFGRDCPRARSTLVHKADFKRFKRMHPNRIANHVFSLRSFPQQAKTPITRREEICHLSFLCRVTIWDALNRNVVVACECS